MLRVPLIAFVFINVFLMIPSWSDASELGGRYCSQDGLESRMKRWEESCLSDKIRNNEYLLEEIDFDYKREVILFQKQQWRSSMLGSKEKNYLDDFCRVQDFLLQKYEKRCLSAQ